ncbi:MAG: hypothetical protein QM773_13190 [Hyphomonadaceae bacterium]
MIDEASILNIQALTPRQHPGRVIPPPPPDQPKDKGPGMMANAEKEVLDQTQKKYNDNFLGDIAGLLNGTDYKDQLKTMQGNLKSDARIKELEKELKDKQAKWEAKLKELPQGPEFKAYETRIKALKFDFKNPTELAKNVQRGRRHSQRDRG